MPQGTIKIYDPESRTGAILDDAKNEIQFDEDAFRGTGVRYFRIGQRVKFHLEGEGVGAKVRDLTLVTL